MAAEQRGKFKGASFDYDAILLQMKALEAELKAKDRQIENLQERLSRQEGQSSEQAEAAALRVELQMKRQQLESSEIKARSTVQGLETDLKNSRFREKETKAVAETLTTQIEILSAKLQAQEGLASACKLLEAENAALKLQFASHSTHLQEAQASETEQLAKLRELSDENADLKASYTKLQELLRSHEGQLETLRETLETHGTETLRLKKQIEDSEISKTELLGKLTELSQALHAKGQEVDQLKAQLKEQQQQGVLDFKIVLSVEEPVEPQQLRLPVDQEPQQLRLPVDQEPQQLRLRCSTLEQRAADYEVKIRDSWRERGFLQEQLRQQETKDKQKQEESRRQLAEFKGRLAEAERQTKEWKDQYFELEVQMEEREESLQDLKAKLEEEVAHSQEQEGMLSEMYRQAEGLEKTCRVLNSELRVLSEEKDHLEREVREKDSQIKQLSGTIGKLEFNLASKKNQLDRLELVTVNQAKQLDILAKKLTQAQGSLKQSYVLKLKQAGDRLASYEQEISMLKDMVKSTKMIRRRQVHKYASPLPAVPERVSKLKKDSSFNPEMRGIRSPELNKDETPVAEMRTPDYRSPIRTTDYKEQESRGVKSLRASNSPFKIASPIKQATLETKRMGRSSSLSAIVRGYLTSLILCEKERIDLLEKCRRADSGSLNYLPKSTLGQLFEGELVDTAALAASDSHVDYKAFLMQNCLSQIESLKQELESHFISLSQHSVSLSELRLLGNSLRPLQQKVWLAILDRLSLANSQEVEVSVLREHLCQLTVSLG
jgi:DNA repair exonuclease SbcCD ATPase subunit